MEEITIEIDEELLTQLNEIVKPMGMRPEWLTEQFIRFCADPNNYDDVKSFFDKCKKDGLY